MGVKVIQCIQCQKSHVLSCFSNLMQLNLNLTDDSLADLTHLKFSLHSKQASMGEATDYSFHVMIIHSDPRRTKTCLKKGPNIPKNVLSFSAVPAKTQKVLSSDLILSQTFSEK